MTCVHTHLAYGLFLILTLASTASQRASAEQFDLKEDWKRFYDAVSESDAEQTLAIRDSLDFIRKPRDLYVRAHSVLATRLTKLDRYDAAVDTLERGLATSKGGEPVPDTYDMAWISALNQLCETLVKKGELKQIPARISQYDNRVSGYGQQASFAGIQLKWKRAFHGTEAVAEEAQAVLANFAVKLPREATPFEIKGLLDIAQSPACPLYERISVILQCRDVAQSSLRKQPVDDNAVAYFKRTIEASYAAAKLYIRNNAVHGDVEELVASLEQCNRDLQKAAADMRTRDFGDEAIIDFIDYVKRRMEKAFNPKPTIYESTLLGKQAPALKDALVIQGETPEVSSDTNSIVLLDFWETWCGPCIAAFPKLNSLGKRHGDSGLRVVGVAGLTHGVWDAETVGLTRDLTAERETRVEAMKSFVQHHKLMGDQLVDENGTIKRAFGVSSFPTYVLIDGSGKVQLVAGGGSQAMDIVEKKIVDLLGAEGQK